MPVIRLYANLRQAAGVKEIQVPPASSGEARTLRELMVDLCRRYPLLGAKIMDGDRVREHFIVSVNGRNVQLAQGLETPVSADDEVAIFPPIAGG